MLTFHSFHYHFSRFYFIFPYKTKKKKNLVNHLQWIFIFNPIFPVFLLKFKYSWNFSIFMIYNFEYISSIIFVKFTNFFMKFWIIIIFTREASFCVRSLWNATRNWSYWLIFLIFILWPKFFAFFSNAFLTISPDFRSVFFAWLNEMFFLLPLENWS